MLKIKAYGDSRIMGNMADVASKEDIVPTHPVP